MAQVFVVSFVSDVCERKETRTNVRDTVLEPVLRSFIFYLFIYSQNTSEEFLWDGRFVYGGLVCASAPGFSPVIVVNSRRVGSGHDADSYQSEWNLVGPGTHRKPQRDLQTTRTDVAPSTTSLGGGGRGPVQGRQISPVIGPDT